MLYIDNSLPDLDQHGLNALSPIPIAEDRKLYHVHVSVLLVHERKVDSGQELDDRSRIRIVFIAGDLETVDSVFVHGLLCAA